MGPEGVGEAAGLSDMRITLDAGLAQITNGMAWWYRKYAHEQSPEDQRRCEFAEQEAEAKKAGLWHDKYRNRLRSSGPFSVDDK